MDPTGGAGLWVLVAIIAIIAAVWIFAPTAWAIGVTVGLVALFVAFIVFVFSNARFT